MPPHAIPGRIERWFFPLVLLALALSAVVGPRVPVDRWLGVSRAAADTIVLATAILVFWPTIALFERLRPERPEWNRPHDDLGADVLHLVFSGTLAQVFFQATLGALALAAGVRLSERWGGSLWPVQAPIALQLALALAVAELGHYWFHRLSHENPWVWRLHATHHSARRLYWLNATRFQWLDIFSLIALQSTPLLLLGAGREALLSYTMFAAVYGQLQHMNVRVHAPVLDWVFSTPGLHRWHHSTDPREGNSNYGAILILWDQVFRTVFRPVGRAFDADLGIAAMPAFPTGYIAQQLSPFRWKRITPAGPMRAIEETIPT